MTQIMLYTSTVYMLYTSTVFVYFNCIQYLGWLTDKQIIFIVISIQQPPRRIKHWSSYCKVSSCSGVIVHWPSDVFQNIADFCIILSNNLYVGVAPEVPQLNVSYKPQKISPKTQNTVRQLFHERIRDSYIHPQFISDVIKPLQIENVYDQQVDIPEPIESADTLVILLLRHENFEKLEKILMSADGWIL